MSAKDALVFGLGSLAGMGVGALIGRASARPQEYSLPIARHSPSIEPEEPRGEFEFTYYYDKFEGAFSEVALRHMEALEAKGFTVRRRYAVKVTPIGIRQFGVLTKHQQVSASTSEPRRLRILT